jgi:hypothetical protein
LESVCRGNSTEGSNPSLSATYLVLPVHLTERGIGRLQHVSTVEDRCGFIQQSNRRLDGAWTDVHVALRGRQILMPSHLLNRCAYQKLDLAELGFGGGVREHT